MRRTATRHAQMGLSLVEILISLALGIFMLAGIISLMASVSSTRSELSKTSAQIENGRYALQLLNDEVSLAGFYGRYSPRSSDTRSLPDPCEDEPVAADLGFVTTPGAEVLPVAVQGFAAGATLPSCITSAAGGAVADTEALVVHRVGVEADADPASLAAGGTPYLQISSCETDASDIVLDDDASALILQDNECTSLAEAWPYLTRIFYVAPCQVCDGASPDSRPTLKVAEYFEGEFEIRSLVSDVEDIHFEYGLDRDGDGGPDCYVGDPNMNVGSAGFPAACTSGWEDNDAASWANVVAVQVYLLVRSETPSLASASQETYDMGGAARVGPFADRYRRQVYTTSIVLPNVAGPRE